MSERSNRLIAEKSPYLQQHAHNPVDWYPWGEEAFEKARQEDKPIFLSIGYSTCHWCHVMARESFEDREIADFLNQYFISIKVDREERPDIDNVYMQACLAMTGSGGWPLTIFMTPEKQPFLAGTYFPKERKWGMPGLKEILPQVHNFWIHEREKILSASTEIIDFLEQQNPKKIHDLDKGAIHETFRLLEQRFDQENGGFGVSPKFPTPHYYSFLLRFYYQTGNQRALDMAKKSLTAMRMGGLYDHLGYGFHRYSTDQMFLVPHFEKMLYDQANLLEVYLEAFQITKEDLFRETVEEVISYLKREMLAPEGVFYSAESAESEGEEGKFYTFTEREISEILGKKQAELISKLFNIKEKGNYRDEATKNLSGKNILYLRAQIPQKSKTLVKNSLEKLFLYRKTREKPAGDNKIITAWNGLLISSLAKAGGVFPRSDSLKIAEKAACFIIDNLYLKDRLFRRYREGEVKIKGYLDDYAFFIRGLISLFQVSQKEEYLDFALKLTREMIELFWDEKKGGFFLNGKDSEKMILEIKDTYDGAFSSSNTIAAYDLMRLSNLTQDSEIMNIAQKQIDFMSRFASNNLTAYAGFMSFLDLSLSPSREIVLVNDREKKLLHFLNKSFLPDTNYLYPSSLLPWTEAYQKGAKEPTVFICENFACKKPLHSIKELKGALLKRN
jgi:uncharacterized protein YyaL (SSP411 family)